MAKLVLGRNLGELLHDRAKKSGDPFASDAAPIGSGVRSLMRGASSGAASAAPAMAPSKSSSKSAMPAWYLFGADILLTAVAVVVVFRSPHPLPWQKEVFCAAAVVLGACLSLGAVLRGEENQFKS